jgi:hypothetical protein
MRILSVDLGVRNLAWCVLDREASKESCWKASPFDGMSVNILHWRLVDVTEGEELNLNETDVAACVPLFVAALKAHREELTEGVELALLEQQPVGRYMGSGKAPVSNIRTKVLSHIFQAFLLEHGVKEIRFVSPRLKTADIESETYRERKQAAKMLARQSLDTIGGGWASWWDERKGKKDDLADALLQGIVAARRQAPQKRKIEKKEEQGKRKMDDDEEMFIPDV